MLTVDAAEAPLVCGDKWRAHVYPWGDPAEVWTVAVSPHEGEGGCTVWSGADDALMKRWDTR